MEDRAFELDISSKVKLEDVETSLAQLKKDIEDALNGFNGSPKQIEKFERALRKLEQRAEKARDKIKQVSEAKIKGDAWKTASENLKKYQNQLKESEGAFAKIGAGTTQTSNLQEMKNYLSQCYELENKIPQLKKQLADLRNHLIAPTPGKGGWIKEIGSLKKEISESEKRFNAMNNQMAEFEKKAGTSFEEATDGLQNMQTEIDNIKQGMADGLFFEDTTEQTQRAIANFDLIKDSYAQLLNDIRNGDFSSFENQLNVAGQAVNALSKRFDKLLSVIKRVGKALGQILKTGITKAFGLLSKTLGLTTKNSNDFNSSLRKGLRLLLRYGLGVRSFFFLFRKIRSAFADGIKYLVLFDNQLNISVSRITSAFKQLKYSISSAFAPLVKVLEPYVTYIIKLLNRILDGFGMFSASLFGQKTYMKVAPISEDFAASLQDTADGADDATKKVKDLTKAAKDYLSPIDEINKLDKDTTDTSNIGGIGGGGAGAGAGDLVPFEEVEVADKFKDIAKRIRELIKAQDWEGLGAYVAKGINKGMQKIYNVINWKNVGPKIVPFITAFTRTFNSLVANIHWDLIGRTLGAGINTLVNTFILFIEGINWKLLGNKIATGIRGALLEINFENIGRALADKFMIIPDILYGIVDRWTRDGTFSVIGQKIGDLINGFFNNISLSDIAITLANILNGIGKTLKSLAEEIEWGDIASQISTAINDFFNTLSPEDIAGSLRTFALNLLNAILQIVDDIKWNQVGEKIAGILEGLDLSAIISVLAQIGLALLDGLFSLWTELPTGVKVATGALLSLQVAFTVLSGSISAVGTALSLMRTLGVTSIGGLIQAIAPIATVIGGIIAIVVGAVTSILSFFDMLKNGFSWAKEAIMLVGIAIAAVGAILLGAPAAVAGIIAAIVAVVATVIVFIKEHWEGIKEFVTGAIQTLKEVVVGIVVGLKNTIINTFTILKTKIQTLITNIKTGVIEKWNDLKTKVSDIVVSIKNKVVEVWNNLKSTTASIWEGIVNAIKTPINAIIGFINRLIEGVVSGINNMTSVLNGLQIDIPDWVPLIGGGTLGFNIPQFNAPQIPYLAQGAVIPPNNAFMAVLGDQRRGNNLELPEDLLRKIVREESGNDNDTYKIQLIVSGRQILETVINEAELKQRRNGSNPFALGRA